MDIKDRTAINDFDSVGVLLIYLARKEILQALSLPTHPRLLQQISVKLLNGTVIKVTGEPTDTVQTLKERVEAANSELAVGTLTTDLRNCSHLCMPSVRCDKCFALCGKYSYVNSATPSNISLFQPPHRSQAAVLVPGKAAEERPNGSCIGLQ